MLNRCKQLLKNSMKNNLHVESWRAEKGSQLDRTTLKWNAFKNEATIELQPGFQWAILISTSKERNETKYEWTTLSKILQA